MAGKTFYATLAAGIAFIAIGIASSIYSTIPVDVRLDKPLAPGQVDVITPEMNVGSTASITVTGSSYEVSIEDPNGQVIVSDRGNSTFTYDLTAEKEGEYSMTVNNTGTAEVMVTGHAETKSSPLGITAALMVAVTGIIVIGLGLRFRRR